MNVRVPDRKVIATRLDLLRSTGVRHAWRRLQQDRRHQHLAPERHRLRVREMWLDAAAEVGAEVRELSPLLLEIRRETVATRVMGQRLMLNDSVSIAVADDKLVSYELLAAAGLPVPEHLAFEPAHRGPAVAFVAKGPIPCVIKPARASGGDGVTGGIRRASHVRRAVVAASRFPGPLVIERHVPGLVHRFLVLDGEILGVLRQQAPHVVGDGRSTIGQLILAEYDRRLDGDCNAALKPFVVNLDCLLALEQAGLSLITIPDDGEAVAIKTVSNHNSPAENETAREPIAPELREEITRAPAALGLRLAGVDVITTDASRGLVETGGVILDVNGIPSLHHHYLVANPTAANRVAVPVVRALLAEGRSKPGATPRRPTAQRRQNRQ